MSLIGTTEIYKNVTAKTIVSFLIGKTFHALKVYNSTNSKKMAYLQSINTGKI